MNFRLIILTLLVWLAFERILSAQSLEAKQESHFSLGAYNDPSPGFPFAIKVGEYGIAVRGYSVFLDNVGHWGGASDG